MNSPSTKQIKTWIAQISESNRQAFDRLFRAFYPQLVQFAIRYTHDQDAAADLTQEAFITVWNKRRELPELHSPKAYLYRMVRNSALNYIRDHASRKVSLEEAADSTHEHEESRQITESVTEDTDKRQLRLLKGWIEELPKRRREAFELSRFEGLEHDEIAEVMEISPNTVNNHIVAALDYLKNRHEEYRKEDNAREF